MFAGLCFLAGPGLMMFWGYEIFRRSNAPQAQAAGEVVRVVEHRGSGHSVSHCPVFRWEHDGNTYEEESNTCGGQGESNRFTVGQTHPIRFEVDDPAAVVLDEESDIPPEMMALPVFGLLFTGAFLFFVWPDRKHPATPEATG